MNLVQTCTFIVCFTILLVGLLVTMRKSWKVPLTISYKTGKVNRKHIKFDIPNIEKFRLEIPLLEYKRNSIQIFDRFMKTAEYRKWVIFEWTKSEVLTWQDLALRIKSDCKRALISQVCHYRFSTWYLSVIHRLFPAISPSHNRQIAFTFLK